MIGPDSTANGWRVARVVQVIPARLRSFEEARTFLAHDWDQEEGERRLRALFARLRRTRRIEVNQRALAALVSGG